MANIQNSTKIKEGTLIPRPYGELTAVQRSYIDYKALGGIITDDDNSKKMTVEELAHRLGVTRDAIYKSLQYVPNVDDLITQRRKELSSGARLHRLHTLWYVHAQSFKDWRVTEAWLRNFDPNFKEPRQKVEHELGGGMADALNLARERHRQIANIQEGEVVDVAPTDN